MSFSFNCCFRGLTDSVSAPLSAFPLHCHNSLALTEASQEEAHQQVQVPAQAERQVRAMDSLLLTKVVYHRAESLPRFPHLQIETGYIFQMAPRWKQLAMLLTSTVSWAVVRKVHTDELLIISISSIGVRKSTLTPITL